MRQVLKILIGLKFLNCSLGKNWLEVGYTVMASVLKKMASPSMRSVMYSRSCTFCANSPILPSAWGGGGEREREGGREGEGEGEQHEGNVKS